MSTEGSFVASGTGPNQPGRNPFHSPFLLGVVAIATLAVEHADAVESFPQSCRIRHCPDGWQHPETDVENWMLICQNNPDASYLCFEEQGSVTSDQGYGVSPRYTCWKSCMKGHDASKASDAPNGSDVEPFAGSNRTESLSTSTSAYRTKRTNLVARYEVRF